MKFVIIALAVIATTEVQAFKCVQGADGTKVATDCPANTNKCSGPKWTEYVGYATGVEWKCGACPANTPTCEDCATDSEAGCNKKKTITAYKCLDYTVATANSKTSIKKKGTDASCQRSETAKSTCNKPTLTSVQTTYTSPNGACGICKADQKGKTCVECDGEKCNTLAAKKCVQGDGKAAAADCDELTETKCFQPIFTDYVGFAKDVKYGCGACPSSTTAATCKTCTAATDKGCNTVETTVDYKCYSYTFDTTAKAFKKAAAEVTCPRKSASAVACNQPDAGATATTYTSTSGCGPCKSGEKDKAKGCKECAKEKCNSATSVTALLMPLLAMIYTLY